MKISQAFILLSILFNLHTMYAETRSENYSHQKYNIAKLVEVAISHINADNDVNFLFDSFTSNEENEMQHISGQSLNHWMNDFLQNATSSECVGDFLYTFKSLASPGGVWAAKMIDSWGKPESGVIQGNLKWLGDFDECIDVYAPAKVNSTLGDFHGQYCSLAVTFHSSNMSLPLTLGTCLPDSCHLSNNQSDVVNQINWQIPSHMHQDTKPVLGDTKFVCTPTSRKLTAEAIAVICLISVFVLLALVGSSVTAINYFCNNCTINCCNLINYCCELTPDSDSESEDPPENDDVALIGTQAENGVLKYEMKNFFNCFCIFTNGAKLLDTSSSEGQLSCLHGIRFLSLAWVIVCHTYAFSFTAIRNISEAVTLIDNLPFQIILNGFFSVDSFFLLSGFLVSYLFFDQASKNDGKISWIYFYIHRYIRLTPVYMIILAIDATLYSYLGSGPSWVTYDTDPVCQKSWWMNLLYINNFQHGVDQCFAWSWYLANDMQFFVISPVILVALWRWPRFGYLILIAFFTTTIVSNIIITYHFDLITGLGNILSITDIQDFMVKWMNYFDYLYVRPYTRMGPYLVGILLAFILYRRKQGVIPMYENPLSVCIVTIGAFWSALIWIFGTYHSNMSLVESCLYNAFSRPVFAFCVAWIIYICLIDQGGFINSFLSYRLFIPLSRLTYCAYLVHPMILIGYFGSLKSLISFSHITMVALYLGLLVVSYFAALIASLLFESPVIRLDKYFRSKFSRT